MAGTSANGLPVALLRKIASARPAPVVGERCEMCGEPIPDEHQHVVDIESHAMMCTCRPCYLLFTDSTAHLRYRSVPDRYLSFPDFELGPGQWDELEIPVGLAFFFRSSKLDRTVAFYPGPAGATESELPLNAWDALLARNPALSVAAPDTEALLIRGPGADRPQADCHLVPVDACYELVGHLRRVWRGFDGGQEAREQLAGFFERLGSRSKPLHEDKRGRDGRRVSAPGGRQ
ncbi:DUF5947 family protein [Arthrobacter bambusae]|uniref:DUF5947 family protein n=1 Tax=Arthrobacter bambusae TaxID=1338426 RepID=UPI002789245B|nr:DUF5947 family protein [Arthrobacter bambusae]MDQ0032117.1 hypothetical protein [Arthrobacter bambusae]MDQ0100277.1 hypothetical protein [Arthrobacter bambusae]